MNYIFAVTMVTVLLEKFLAHDAFHKQRIVGGRKVTINNYPFQLCLIIKSSEQKTVVEFRGSAVIVSTWWAFTSANNIAYIDPNLIEAGFVYLRGNVTKWKADRNHNDHTIIETSLHPKYKTYARDYNLALVKVKEPFKGVHEKPIKVVGKKYKYQDKLPVNILGWGKTDVSGRGPSNTLMIATVELVNQEKCNKLYSTGFISPLTERMICAAKTSTDPCTYDSGGPLIYKSNLLLACPYRENRIVGGTPVKIEDCQYQLAILVRPNQAAPHGKFKGGAVIISYYWAATAAQCVQSMSIWRLEHGLVYVRGNTSYWNRGYYVDHTVILKEAHPFYNTETNDYDFALLKVHNPFTGRFEKPIVLPGKHFKIPVNANVRVSGWGTINNYQQYPENHLRAVVLTITDDDDCKDVYLTATNGIVTDRMICAWSLNKDSCAFDAGGPMVYKDILIGVVSWGARCGSPIYPGVYTKVSQFYTWIRNYEQYSGAALQIMFKIT